MKRKSQNPYDQQLPKRVYIQKRRIVYIPYENGKRGKEIYLAKEGTPLNEVLRLHAEVVGKPASIQIETVDGLISVFLNSSEFRRRSPRTQRDYEYSLKRIQQRIGISGVAFGSVPLSAITPGTIRTLLDRFATTPVQINREIAALSAAFSFAYERDLCASNPCLKVRRNREKARRRFVTDDDYTTMYVIAQQSNSPYLAPLMELMWLCRMRKCEVLDLRLQHGTPEGVLIERRKGSKTQIVAWSERLRCAFYQWLELSQGISESGLDSAWQRLAPKFGLAGVERFTLHDLKARGVSLYDGDKQEAAGHKSAAMIDVYDRKVKIVKPTA